MNDPVPIYLHTDTGALQLFSIDLRKRSMDKCIGQVCYEAYCNYTGWKSLISGATLPQWSELKPEIQEAWHAAAHAVL